MVEVVAAQLHYGLVQRFSPLFGVSDHDHLRGEVRVRFFALPSDVFDQNPHDGCHRLHHHRHDTGPVSDLSSQGTDIVATVWIGSIALLVFRFLLDFCVYGKLFDTNVLIKKKKNFKCVSVNVSWVLAAPDR